MRAVKLGQKSLKNKEKGFMPFSFLGGNYIGNMKLTYFAQLLPSFCVNVIQTAVIFAVFELLRSCI